MSDFTFEKWANKIYGISSPKKENDELKHYCEECPNETNGFYLCDDCEEEQFNKDEENKNNE